MPFKKYGKKIISCFLVICTLLCGNVFAADIPIKEIFTFTSSSNILVFTESKELYLANSIKSSSKTLLSSNVAEVYSLGGIFDNHTTETFLVILSNGKALTFSFERGQENYSKNEWNTDIKTYVLTKTRCIYYINQENAFVQFNFEDNQEKVIVPNARHIQPIDFGQIYLESFYIIMEDWGLYKWEDGDMTFVMSDVVQIKRDNTASTEFEYFLKNNGELYLSNSTGIYKVMADVSPGDFTSPRNFSVVIDKNLNLYYIRGNDAYISQATSFTVEKIAENITGFIDSGAMNWYITSGNGDIYHGNSIPAMVKINTQGHLVQNVCLGGNLITVGGERLEYTGQNYSYDVVNDLNFGSIQDSYYIMIEEENYLAYLRSNGELWYVDKNFLNNQKSPLCEKSTIIKINKQEVRLNDPIQIINGRTMYPLRECFNAMGASVQWDGERQVAAGEVPGIKIEFPIGKNEYYINGVRHEMDTAAYIDDSIGRTYIPIRYAAEGLGFTVDWIEGDLENTIDIYK